MYKTVRRLHIELTDKCNARCPMCVRTAFSGKEESWLLKRELYLDDFMQIVTPDDLDYIEHINFCGNYGEPLAARDLIPILEYIWKHNSTIFIEVASNGHPRNEDWWWDLCQVVHNKPFKVVFGIDGINQEQHEMYRRNTSFNRIMQNAEFFINNGGNAEWQMLIFKHNEESIGEAAFMSVQKGFSAFRPVVTERFWSGDYEDYEYKGKTYRLEMASRGNKLKETGLGLNHKVKINCFARMTQEAYIDCMGYVTPCCYLGLYVYAVLAGRDRTFHNQTELMDMFSEMDLNRLQAKGKGLSKVVQDKWFDDLLLMHMKSMPERCYKVCGAKVENKEYV